MTCISCLNRQPAGDLSVVGMLVAFLRSSVPLQRCSWRPAPCYSGNRDTAETLLPPPLLRRRGHREELSRGSQETLLREP